MKIKNIEEFKSYIDQNYSNLLIEITIAEGSYYANVIKADNALIFSLSDNDLAVHNIVVKELISIKNNVITVNVENENSNEDSLKKAYIIIREYREIEIEDFN